MLRGANKRAQNLLETQCVGLGRRGKAPYIGASERWVPSSGSNTLLPRDSLSPNIFLETPTFEAQYFVVMNPHRLHAVGMQWRGPLRRNEKRNLLTKRRKRVSKHKTMKKNKSSSPREPV